MSGSGAVLVVVTITGASWNSSGLVMRGTAALILHPELFNRMYLNLRCLQCLLSWVIFFNTDKNGISSSGKFTSH